MSLAIRRSILFACLFIVFTIVGTLTHELGHIIVAKWFGYQTTLHYGSMNWHSGPLDTRLVTILNEYGVEIEEDIDFPSRREYFQLNAARSQHEFWILVGGPVQTIATGLIGFFILLLRRSKPQPLSFNWLDWLAVFFALFWLRLVFNPIIYLIDQWYQGNDMPLRFFGDEYLIARMIRLKGWELPILFGLIGTVIVTYVLFNLIPRHKRNAFIAGGCIGGLLGYWIWMKILGPVVLP